jgi:predicted Zn-ribbon and HTH transcriptional regulator
MMCARQDEEAARRDEEPTTEEDVVQTSSPLSSADVVLQLLPTTATTIEREAHVLKNLIVLKLTYAHLHRLRIGVVKSDILNSSGTKQYITATVFEESASSASEAQNPVIEKKSEKFTNSDNTLVGVVKSQSQAPQMLTFEDLAVERVEAHVTIQILKAAEEGKMTQTTSNDESNNAIIDDVHRNNHGNRNEEVILDSSCCTICVEEYKEGDFVCFNQGMSISCKHAFHKDCLLPWLMKDSTCPNCRSRWIGEDG